MTTSATADQTLYGFIYWARRNHFNGLNTVHWDEIQKMVDQYVITNATDASLSSADPLSYGDAQDYPTDGSTGLGDGTGVLAETPTQAICDQSRYPNEHYGA